MLTAGERPEGEVTRPAGERFTHLPHQQQVCRTGEQEATRFAVPVDGPLHGAEQRGFLLHLVERDRLVASHKCLGIAPGGSEHVEVIQGAVAPFARNQWLGQGAFTGLPSARHHHRRHHRQPIGEGTADQPGQGIHHVDDFHSRGESLAGLTIQLLHGEEPVQQLSHRTPAEHHEAG